MKNLIRYIIFMLIGVSSLCAKRSEPSPVAPVIVNGVRFEAPNQNSGKIIYLEAHRATDGALLYRKEIYRNIIWPWLEEDVQWDFIKSLNLVEDRILIVSEKGKSYLFEPKTQKILAPKKAYGRPRNKPRAPNKRLQTMRFKLPMNSISQGPHV